MIKLLKIVMPIGILMAVIGTYKFIQSINHPEHHDSVALPAPMVAVTTAKGEDMNVPVYTRGTVMPGNQVQLLAEVNGPVVEVSPNFTKGGFFRKGEVLFRVDPQEYDITIKKAQAQQAQAYQYYLQAKAEYQARSRLKTSNQLASFESQYRQAEAAWLAAKADLEAVRIQRNHAVVRAPFDGRVLNSAVNLGQYLRLGQQLGLIYSVDVAEIRLPLSDRFLSLVDVPGRQVGDEVIQLPEVIFSENYSGKTYTWKGQVVRAEGSVDEHTRLLYLVAEVSDPYGADPQQPGRPELVVGSFVEARIAGQRHERIFPIPRQSLHHGNQVWVVNNQRLEKRDIDVLYKAGDLAYVTSGLNEGEQLVVSPLDVAVDGMTVRVQQSGNYQELEEQEAEPSPFAGTKKVQDAVRDVVKIEGNKATLDISPLKAVELAAKAKKMADSLTPEQKQQLKDAADNLAGQIRNLQQKVPAPVQKPSVAAEQSAPQAEPGMSPLAATLEADMAASVQPAATPTPDTAEGTTAGQSTATAASRSITTAIAPAPLREAAQ